MNTRLILTALLTSLTVFCVNANASKVITLQDGSQIKGTLVDVSNGQYVIETESFGTVSVPEGNVVSVAVTGATSAPQTNNGMNNPYGNMGSNPMMQQVAGMQTQIMNNPQLMMEIQKMAEDPEIMQLLTDQTFMSMMMSGNPEAMQNDPRMQQMMNNPKMQRLIQLIMDSQQ